MTTGGFFRNLTWTCMVCGRDRPDEHVSVLKKRMSILEHDYDVNIRYCNDTPGCLAHAEGCERMGDLRVPHAP